MRWFYDIHSVLNFNELNSSGNKVNRKNVGLLFGSSCETFVDDVRTFISYNYLFLIIYGILSTNSHFYMLIYLTMYLIIVRKVRVTVKAVLYLIKRFVINGNDIKIPFVSYIKYKFVFCFRRFSI